MGSDADKLLWVKDTHMPKTDRTIIVDISRNYEGLNNKGRKEAIKNNL